MKGYQIKGIMLAGLLAIVGMPQGKVYAGSLNANEQQLLAYASGIFEYKGHTYKATSAALAMARAKLCEDGVDLTDSQLSRAYAEAADYIGTAVYNGYLVRTDWGKEEATEEEPSSKPSENETTNNSGNNNSGTNNSENKKPNQEQDSSQTDNKNEGTTSNKNPNVVTDGYDKYYTNEDTTSEQTASESNTKDTVTIEKYMEGTVSVTDGETVIFESSLPVKNTGFTIKNSLFTIGALGGILILTVFEAMKFIHFARGKDE